ncbi:helix-turn-helix transcriptional regulator [Priestia megaterium]|jgi:putative transcriptional regulator|uniref:helix-turn-helix transcriptional regulator n=1 Tax=Priestia megaterium TaxID=1404 RepID=UPI002E1BA349|nr:helix-turn-helix transcriptional regulator [Priestia megaterium]
MKNKKRENLRKQRKKNDLTQAQVAEKLGISRVMYNQIETGVKGVRLELAFKLSSLFEKPLEELFGEVEN